VESCKVVNVKLFPVHALKTVGEGGGGLKKVETNWRNL
jgi:hypothetical protein